MAKYYLYFLFSIFIFINIVGNLEKNIIEVVKKEENIKYRLKKQKLYASNIKLIEKMLEKQKSLLDRNKKPFFLKKTKETIVFSEIEQNIQNVFKKLGGKITQLNSGVVIKNKFYKKYPINLTLFLIPEDLHVFLKKLYLNDKYIFIDAISIYRDRKKKMIEVRVRLIGYQLL